MAYTCIRATTLEKLIIDYPERVKCNVCGKWIKPAKGNWTEVYLVREEDDNLVFPRCADCQAIPPA